MRPPGGPALAAGADSPAPAAGYSTAAIDSFLAFDFGTRRIGLATGNSLTRRARPLRTLALEGRARFAAIGALIAEWQPSALVVGVPFHPDGAAHENTERARRFARQLHGRFGLAVHEVDERYTTTSAAGAGARDLDAAAAAIILDQFLNAVPPSAGTASELRPADAPGIDPADDAADDPASSPATLRQALDLGPPHGLAGSPVRTGRSP